MKKEKTTKQKLIHILKERRMGDEFEFWEGGGRKGTYAANKYFAETVDIILAVVNGEPCKPEDHIVIGKTLSTVHCLKCGKTLRSKRL